MRSETKIRKRIYKSTDLSPNKEPVKLLRQSWVLLSDASSSSQVQVTGRKMPAPQSRPIKKPRISLSCIVCRRRKVGCGREQPECANCVRMKENCVYQAMTRDESTGRVRPLSPSPQNCHYGGSDPHPHSKIRPGQPSPSRPASRSNHLSDPRPHILHSHPHPHPHQQSVGPSDPAVPSWEEATQLPNDPDAYPSCEHGSTATSRGPFESPEPAAYPFKNSKDPNYPRPTPLYGDYLSLRRGGHVRYIGPTFWGFVAGKLTSPDVLQESLSDDFFDENHHTPPGLPLPHISSVGMFNLLRSLPTKPVSDALLESFFVAVWPLSSLLHPPILQADYDQFWDWCRNSDNALPSEKLLDDPTLICLLFAVLYCGASAAPAASWTHSNLQGLQKETIVSHLQLAYMTSLSLCQHQEHPTLNTLISSLLTEPLLDRPLEPMRNLLHVSTTVRIAKMMGLHRERAWSMLNPVDREIRRRVWWHIVWLDVQSSISTGLDLCCGTETLETVRMVDSIDEETSDLPSEIYPSNDFMAGRQSVAIIYAIGRFQMARLQAWIVAHLQSPQGPTEKGIGKLVTDAKQLLQKMNSLIALLSTQAVPERGYISSRLANVSPFTHPSMYKDDASQPTVFAAWTRIMLTLMKFELAILLRKPFLLHQTPAFAPYAWFCCSHYGPSQCVFITLIYLHSFPGPGEIFLARHLVDEFIHHRATHDKISDPWSTSSTRNNSEESESNGGKMRMPLAIQALVELHNRLDSSRGPQERPLSQPDTIESSYRFAASHLATKATSHLRVTPNQTSAETSSSANRTNHNCETPATVTGSPPVVARGSKPGLPNSIFETESEFVPDMNFLPTILDLEAWSSMIILESDDILANPDNPMNDHPITPGLGMPKPTYDKSALSGGLTFSA
ncbi:Transcription factor [Penicillium verhagenii]|uniref:Transcription factor n=1 Tax=Penicillium verhagenii TaxID=1562060 RepID=UPI00254510D2|nr:Transcription factor [Penicillium verhagenii]KAJ5939549.1 Transcription factor [Penicillium verhagenii]